MSLTDNCRMINFRNLGDSRGGLVAVEGNADIPFEIKRIFYIFDTDTQAVRGRHANRESEFFMICLNGSLKVKVTDGANEKIFELDSADAGLYIPKMVWKEMYDFSKNAVLVVLSDKHYDANEYVRDYQKYVAEIKGFI